MNDNGFVASVITLVEKQKKNNHRYNLFINDVYAFSVHEDILIKHRLLKGEQVDSTRLADVLQDAERHDAYMKAIRFIGRRPRSIKEVQQKLKQEGYEDEIVQGTIDKMTEQKYINDEEFARLWMEHRIYTQKKGRNVVKQELQQKGLSRDQIYEVLEEVDGDAELQLALELANKKWRHSTGTIMERKRKIAAFLLRRGYTNSIVSKVLQIVSKDHYEPNSEYG